MIQFASHNKPYNQGDCWQFYTEATFIALVEHERFDEDKINHV